MEYTFYKYHGNGNDFIMADNRENRFVKDKKKIAFLCNRHFGIGADGLILLEKATNFDFKMVYYNADGGEGTMCGNGGRCIVAFAYQLGIIKEKAFFTAIDGEHRAEIWEEKNELLVRLAMKDVEEVKVYSNHYFLDTGSPHHISFLNQSLKNYDVELEGKKIRWSEMYENIGGTNVNFVEEKEEGIYVRTFERGVEAETLSCGTGVTASTLAYAHKHQLEKGNVKVESLGGKFEISFMKSAGKYTHIQLCGPAKYVFKTKINL